MNLPIGLLAFAAIQVSFPEVADRVWIEGSSNLAGWSCQAAKFEAHVDSSQVTVRVLARDLKCGNRRMDHDLYIALRATDPAAPSYIVALFDDVPPAGDGARGKLSVAGVEQPVTATISTVRMPDGSTRAQGSVPLRMTDFGVKPPVGLFGLIRSRNEVVVKFDLAV